MRCPDDSRRVDPFARYGIDEAAELMGVCKNTLIKAIMTGRVKARCDESSGVRVYEISGGEINRYLRLGR